jgi:carbon starvation protein
MHRLRYVAITAVPLVWLLIVNFTAGYQKIFSESPRLGFLASARALETGIAAGGLNGPKASELAARILNERLDAAVCGLFLVLVLLIVCDSLRVWIGLLRGTTANGSSESPFVMSQMEGTEQ